MELHSVYNLFVGLVVKYNIVAQSETKFYYRCGSTGRQGVMTDELSERMIYILYVGDTHLS